MGYGQVAVAAKTLERLGRHNVTLNVTPFLNLKRLFVTLVTLVTLMGESPRNRQTIRQISPADPFSH